MIFEGLKKLILFGLFIFAFSGYSSSLMEVHNQLSKIKPQTKKILDYKEKVTFAMIKEHHLEKEIREIDAKLAMGGMRNDNMVEKRRVLKEDLREINSIPDVRAFLKSYLGEDERPPSPSSSTSGAVLKFENLIKQGELEFLGIDSQLRTYEKVIRDRYSRYDFRYLPDGWLTDDVIKAYLKILQGQFPNMRFIPPSISFAAINFKSDMFLEDAVNEAKKELNMEFLVIPLNPTGFHWYLAIYETRTQKLFVYNSFGQNFDTKNMGDWLAKVLRKSFGSVNPVYPLRKGIQNDGFSCGVYTLAFAETHLNRITGEMVPRLNGWIEGPGDYGFGPYKSYILGRLFYDVLSNI